MKELQIVNTTQVALVDDEDYDRLSQFKWRLTGGSLTIVSRQYKKSYKTWVVPLAQEVMQNRYVMFDHIDRDFLNNSKANLRECTTAQNAMNKRKQTAKTYSMFKGVSYDKSNRKWRAMLRFNGRLLNLGSFTNQVDAGIMYNIAAYTKFGEFVHLNPLPTVLC